MQIHAPNIRTYSVLWKWIWKEITHVHGHGQRSNYVWKHCRHVHTMFQSHLQCRRHIGSGFCRNHSVYSNQRIFRISSGIRTCINCIITSTQSIDVMPSMEFVPLQWRHNGRDGISNHQPHYSLLNRLFRRSSKKTPKLRVTSLCAGISPVTGEIPAQMPSNAENVSI